MYTGRRKTTGGVVKKRTSQAGVREWLGLDVRAETNADGFVKQVALRRASQTAPPLVYAPGFGQADGGDTLIRCDDDVRFMVRSALLYSSFPRLIDNSVPSVVSSIEFSYSSDVLLLILRFISNRSFQPTEREFTSNFDTECFQTARKYKLSSLTAWLRSHLAVPDSMIHIGQGPIGIYGLCDSYDFYPEKQQAFLRCIGHIDLEDENMMDTVTNERADVESGLELISRLARREAIINRLFSSSHTFPLDARANGWNGSHYTTFQDLTCPDCQDLTIFRVPSWLAFWSHRTKSEFLVTPEDQCDHIFRVEYMRKRVLDLDVSGTENQNDEAGRIQDDTA